MRKNSFREECRKREKDLKQAKNKEKIPEFTSIMIDP
jgi:hypothetical protein